MASTAPWGGLAATERPVNDLEPYPIPRVGTMRYLERSLARIEENLALDEAILQEVEDDGQRPVLRIWESSTRAVVLGASGRVRDEIHVEACRHDGVVIARRSSGGGTVVIGPGALNAAVVLPLKVAPSLAAVDIAQRSVLECLARALRERGIPVQVLGSGDLTIQGRKVAGSAQRRLRAHFLIHTTLLYDFPLDLIARCLAMPDRQPSYREGRSHNDFLANLGLPREVLVEAVRRAWLPAGEPALPAEVPADRVRDLVAAKFADPSWVERF